MSVTDWFAKGRAPRAGTLHIVERLHLTSAAEVMKLFGSHEGPGWVCTTDRAFRVPTPDFATGIPLSAEIALSEHRSVHMRQTAQGWSAWVLDDDFGDGPHLAFDETLLSTLGGARLRYRTWWRPEPEVNTNGVDSLSVLRPFASRFLGWEDR